MKIAWLLLAVALTWPSTSALAQSGKIAGTVTDASSGEPLPGVNVAIEGTTQGSVTNVEGYYVILNVRPGVYDLRASFIGYTPSVQQGVRVNIDLTSEVNFALREETVGMAEVVVSAERPVVQRDVSASLANIDSEQMENLPVSSVAEVISLQAGFEPGLQIRGSGGDQVAFAVDGVSFADPRSNNPFMEISYTAIGEVQVQTGGFNAEYGNVRSGLINVITKDPPRERYSVDVLGRYSSPSKRYFEDFGSSPADPNSYWMYPRLSSERFDSDGDGVADCEVSLCGTSILPAHLQAQYQRFGGWNTLAEGTGWTPEQMREAQRWYYRKDFDISSPEYEIDGTVSGPVPGAGSGLGNLRFSASFRQTQQPFLVPQQRDSETRRTFQGKLISDVGKGKRLVLSGLYGKEFGLSFTGEGIGYRDVTAEIPGYPWDSRDYLLSNVVGGEIGMFGDWLYSPRDVTRSVFGADYTHTLSPTTFFEVQLQRSASDYLTGAPDPRTETADGQSAVVRCVTPGLELREASSCAPNEIPLTEAPFGYKWRYENSDFGSFGSQRGDARDTSQVVRWSARFDITSQLNRFAQVKTGVELHRSDYDILYGSWDPANPHQENERFRWSRTPMQGALYGQTKLEFKGMIANLGLRADYFRPSGDWYEYEPFTRAFSAVFGVDALDEQLQQEDTESQLTLSPRLGVSFPVTDNSKFYFNYGHFRQMLEPRRLFQIQHRVDGTVTSVGNPNHPLPKTVAYEIGFEQNIANMFLLRLAGFYRDLSLQGRDVTYVSIDDLVSYQRQEPLNFADNRGFEITLQKNVGRWIRGFVNYTYLVKKGGNFGYGSIDENRRAFREFINTPDALSQFKPVPEPFARANIEVLLPDDFGPAMGGFNPLGDWRVALLGEWRQGAPSTWDGTYFYVNATGQDRRLAYNVNWKDFWMFDMRLSKNFATSYGSAQFFVDVTNVFNLRQMYWRRGGGLEEGEWDMRDYFRSLHLPEFDELFFEEYNPGYDWVPGDDQPGDYRKAEVAFDPIYAVRDLASVATIRDGALYYDLSQKTYMTHTNGQWVAADQARVDQVLEDKAYIDMPNEAYFGFLNPRNVFLGLRLTF